MEGRWEAFKRREKKATAYAKMKPKRKTKIKHFISWYQLVCYTAVFSVVTQPSSPELRDDTKNGCVAD